METVSLAFDFLKDETSSIFTDNDGNIESVSSQLPNKQPIYRFRPPQINAIPKYTLTINETSSGFLFSHIGNFFLEVIIMIYRMNYHHPVHRPVIIWILIIIRVTIFIITNHIIFKTDNELNRKRVYFTSKNRLCISVLITQVD